jgi:uncharacterized protein (TIGR00251 family)
MTLPAYLSVRTEGVCLAVKVQPRASRNEIGEAVGSELKIKVTAPPVDSAANEALVKFLAEKLNCARGRVHILRGHSSRHKQVLIEKIPPEEIVRRLSA